MRTIALDFETYYDDECTVKKLGNWGYTRHPKFDAYMISVYDGEDTWVGHPNDFNWESLEGCRVLSHNAAFDEEVYLALVSSGLAPKVNYAEWHCTANMTSYLCGERSLAKGVEVLFGQKLSKQARNDAKGKTWADMQRDGSAQGMLDYAAEDAVWCWKLWDKFAGQWPEHERRLSKLTIEQGRYGVYIDREKLTAGIHKLQRVVAESLDSLPWIQRGYKPASPKGIAEECRMSGIPGMPVKAHDEDAAEEWLETYSVRCPWVQSLKDLRKAKKMLATLETIQLRLRPDGVFSFSLLYFGAHTGRWAGTGGFNMQNMNKEPVFGVDIRGLFIPRPGMKFVIADLAQIEPRCLNWVIGNESLLQKIRDGLGIYEAFAVESLGWTTGPVPLKSANKKLYATAKADVIGLGYGCGPDKFITVAKIMAGLDLCEDDEAVAKAEAIDGQIYTGDKGEAYYLVPDPRQPAVQVKVPVLGANSRKIVREYRTGNPLVTGFWKLLQTQLEESIGSDLLVNLPSGRTLRYKNVRKSVRLMLEKKTGEYTPRLVISAEVEGVDTKLYGVILTENFIQSLARDVFAWGLLSVGDAGYRTLWSAHDELIAEVPIGQDPAPIVDAMVVVPAWAQGLPIEAEAVSADRYLK